MAVHPSLGQKLKAVLEQNYSRMNGAESEHLKKEKKIIEAFYEDIKADIINDIGAGMPTRPVRISASGKHHDVFWILNMPQQKPVALDRADNAFRGLWDNFLRWTAQNDLKVELYYRMDAKVVHDYWFEIRISPDL